MNRFRIFLLTTIITIIPSVATAQNANCTIHQCLNGLANDYNTDYYFFRTTSDVYQFDNRYIYETCVQNLGNSDLEVNWVIPGLHSWVLQGCAVRAQRPHFTDDEREAYSACLRFGAHWSWIRSPFIPHQNDSRLISGEQDVSNCREYYISQTISATPRVHQTSSSVQELSFTVERFGPSVYEETARTLSKISLAISISKPPESENFVTSISGVFSQAYGEQPGYYRPGFRILPYYHPPLPDSFFENRENQQEEIFVDTAYIMYELPIPDEPVQSFLRYSVESVDGRAVASFDVPVWVEPR